MPQFTPGALKTAQAPIIVKPSGLSCGSELYLVSGTTKVATSGLKPFTSTGAAQDIAFPITMPSTTGTYKVYLDIFASGILIGAYQATEDVIISSVPTAPTFPIPSPLEVGVHIIGVKVEKSTEGGIHNWLAWYHHGKGYEQYQVGNGYLYRVGFTKDHVVPIFSCGQIGVTHDYSSCHADGKIQYEYGYIQPGTIRKFILYDALARGITQVTIYMKAGVSIYKVSGGNWEGITVVDGAVFLPYPYVTFKIISYDPNVGWSSIIYE